MILNDDRIEIIKKVEQLLQIPVFLVGGAVRDLLMDKKPKDWDFSSPLEPGEIENAIKSAGKKPYLLGKKFGTIGFKLTQNKANGNPDYIEITSFRNEKYTIGSRKPEVEFVKNMNLDLNRRDFSINSMAISTYGKLYDNHGGLQDLQNGIIKATNNPTIRFKEDPLRMLRAIRFAAILDFEIEEKTWEKLIKNKFELLNISKERWVMEMDKILTNSNVEKGLDLLMKSGLLSIIIPELSLQKDYNQNTPYHDFDLWTHTKNVVKNVPASNLDLRWTALLHDVAKPFVRTKNPKGNSSYIGHELLGAEMAVKICQYLKFSRERTDFIVQNIKQHLQIDSSLKTYDDMGKKKITEQHEC